MCLVKLLVCLLQHNIEHAIPDPILRANAYGMQNPLAQLPSANQHGTSGSSHCLCCLKAGAPHIMYVVLHRGPYLLVVRVALQLEQSLYLAGLDNQTLANCAGKFIRERSTVRLTTAFIQFNPIQSNPI